MKKKCSESKLVPLFQLKWHDSHDGHGEMYYDYNHVPKYHYEDDHHYGKDESDGYSVVKEDTQYQQIPPQLLNKQQLLPVPPLRNKPISVLRKIPKVKQQISK